MFDIGFSELMVIAVVALIVIGPERLPRVARTTGHLVGRLQRYVSDVKADINREIELDELREFKDEFERAAQSVQSDLTVEMKEVEGSFNGIVNDASAALSASGAPATGDAPAHSVPSPQGEPPVPQALPAGRDPARRALLP